MLEIRVHLAGTRQKGEGFHYFSPQEQTPTGFNIRVNCPDFISCLFSTCHLRLCCPLCTDRPCLTRSRSAFQDKIEKQTFTPHKFTALKSSAKVVTPAGLTATQCRAQGTQSRTRGAAPTCREEGKTGNLRLLALKYPFIDTFNC